MAGITPGNPTLVTTVEDERLEFQDGELLLSCCFLMVCLDGELCFHGVAGR